MIDKAEYMIMLSLLIYILDMSDLIMINDT
jgi:hypothetical protein